MRYLLAICFGISSLFLTSCMDLKTTEQLEKITAMNATIDSIEQIFSGHTLDTISEYSMKAYDVEKRIKTNYVADTINMDFARKMNAFKLMRKKMEPLGKTHKLIPSSIEEERETLKKLKNDIKNGDGKREKYAEYIQYEEDKVKQLRGFLTDYLTAKNEALDTYDELYNDLNEFSLSLLEK